MGTEKPQVTTDPWGEGDPRGQAGGAGIRASDAEREDALRVLADHYADGRLDRAEFDERADAAFAARTRGQLRALFRDLPRPAAEAVRKGARVPRPATRPPAPPILILPLLLALGIVAALHGIPPFPLIPLFFLLARRQRRWDRN
ncbi:DUF1707 SHOCT-like domain-containing protein [Actinospica robiniae]|uniref:DUF1707 SHOCT-like domain-containing protein n=1 Tax=Actinospica robiniae TaxID=304901 RepID=UPI0012FA1FC2|nr:DUF1707 domain-containing protein [Actinospica robiniae]